MQTAQGNEVAFPTAAVSVKLNIYLAAKGWLGNAMVLGKLPVPGRPSNLAIVGQGTTALAVGADGGCLDIFTLIYLLSHMSPSLWEMARYRPKYCLKGPLNPKQPTNQQTWLLVRAFFHVENLFLFSDLAGLVLWYDAFFIVLSDEPRQNEGRGLVDRKLVKALR